MINEKYKNWLDFIGNYGIHHENKKITSEQIKQLEERYHCRIEDLIPTLLYPYIPQKKAIILYFGEVGDYK